MRMPPRRKSDRILWSGWESYESVSPPTPSSKHLHRFFDFVIRLLSELEISIAPHVP